MLIKDLNASVLLFTESMELDLLLSNMFASKHPQKDSICDISSNSAVFLSTATHLEGTWEASVLHMTSLSPSCCRGSCCCVWLTLYPLLCQSAWGTAGPALVYRPTPEKHKNSLLPLKLSSFCYFPILEQLPLLDITVHAAAAAAGNSHLVLVVVLAHLVGNLGQDVIWLLVLVLVFGIADHHLDRRGVKLRQRPNTRAKLL